MTPHIRDLAPRLQSIGLDPRFALDVASVMVGIRWRGLLHVPERSFSPIVECLVDSGLHVIAQRPLLWQEDLSSREGVLKSVAPGLEPSDEYWHEVWFARETRSNPVPEELFSNPGRHLGYPDCCVAALASQSSLANHYSVYLFDPRLRAWELNRLTTLFSQSLLMPDFFPCSLACEAAREFVQPFCRLAEDIFGAETVAHWVARARQPLLVWSDHLYAWQHWELRDESLIVGVAGASKVVLGSIATLPKPHRSHEGPHLLAFAHLIDSHTGRMPRRIVIETEDGSSVAVDLVSANRSIAAS